MRASGDGPIRVRPVTVVAAVLAAVLAVLVTAPGAAARALPAVPAGQPAALPAQDGTDPGDEPAPADPAPGAEPDIDEEPGAAPGQAAHFAELLAENPVHISDAVPRSVPRSTAPLYAEQLDRLDVPAYLLVLPYGTVRGGDTRTMLARIHDRLGEDGVYLLLSGGRPYASAFGTDLPADAAAEIAAQDLPRDAGALRVVTEFVDVLIEGDTASRLAEVRARDYEDRPGEMFISHSDRRNQAFLTGLALAGLPLLVLSVAGAIRLARRRGRWPFLVGVPLAVAAGAVVPVVAPQVFDQTVTHDHALPTDEDLSLRVERLAAALDDGPFHVDPELPSSFTPEDRAEITERLAALPEPAFVLTVASDRDAEVGYRVDDLAHLLRAETGEDGTYVLLEPGRQDVRLVGYGSALPLREIRDEIREAGDAALDAEERLTDGEVLDLLLDELETAVPDPDSWERTLDQDWYEAPDLAADRTLGSLYDEDFGGGIAAGVMGALLLGGAFLGTGAVLGHRRHGPGAVTTPAQRARAKDRALEAELRKEVQASAPSRPSVRWLRNTAATELRGLVAACAAADRDGSHDAAVRDRAVHALDAATLLLDSDGSGRTDPDTPPAEVLAALVLLRAGSAVLADPAALSARLCSVNPLHGPATTAETLWSMPNRKPARRALCGPCGSYFGDRAAARRAPVVAGFTLCLPRERDAKPDPGVVAAGAAHGPWGNRWTPYHLLAGPLRQDRPRGVDVEKLITAAREARGVH
ncbi:hypothetical protein [Streptomyces lonarensis]|uniref:Uncharacterized protein n=1 Tax=Streptomyces lonarensis TaxID=700599 RepID=A0A7X6I067_9ACTN|nr:hypothetical protein [Streptomyces lonarensis]NJQ07366.1 hypothetical protein [Streptomyces lonarensis]